MTDKNVPISKLHELFDLDIETGVLRWRVSPSPNVKVGAVGGWENGGGYLCVDVNRKSYRAHRIVFAMVNGRWPCGDVDHKDGNRANNRPSNLREATRSENLRNQKIRPDNKSGFKGVSFYSKGKKWRSYCNVGRKQIHLGYFDSLSEAVEAARAGREKHHGEFARHG